MNEPARAFVADPFRPARRATRVVSVGDVGIGGANPIRVQSMTTTDTQDVKATADQAERLAGVGCEIVRITAPSLRDAEALGEIKAELLRRGVRVPLVADIHFTPNAAMRAAEHVEKVRVNPGNYADKKRFEVREYTEREYREEIERVADRFRPLVRRCRELGRALRIGTNHGSLSDRILNRFGDTPAGMVESALEFLDVCEDEGFRDVVFSMKSSNAQVAIQAYRLLVARLAERARAGARAGEAGRRGEPQASGVPGPAGDYPLHVGVTEAGDGEDGRVKSAIGIGALLEDGLGDTIRVSLTEDPVKEIPVARALAGRYDSRWHAASTGPAAHAIPSPGAPFTDDPYAHARRPTRAVASGGVGVGGESPVRVELEVEGIEPDVEAQADALATALALGGEIVCEGLVLPLHLHAAPDGVVGLAGALRARGIAAPLVLATDTGAGSRSPDELAASVAACDRLSIRVDPHVRRHALVVVARLAARRGIPFEAWIPADTASVVERVDLAVDAAAEAGSPLVVALGPSLEDAPFVHAARLVAARLRARAREDVPIVLRPGAALDADDRDAALLQLATDVGAPLCDGIGDAVSLPERTFGAPGRTLDIAYRILQGARLRTTRTEFISCPSCGRTLFDLEETTARIKARTQHLKGVKIAIMGCIVNGPGEMADADFGYVGSGPGSVNLYVGKELVERHVPAADADDRLVELIRKHGRWVEMPA